MTSSQAPGSLSVLFAGGGTTGHISPLLAIADDLRYQDPEARLTVLGTPEGLETRLVPEAGYDLVTIDKVPMPRSLDTSLVRFPGKLLGTITRVRKLIRERDVDVVVGVGGYVSTPAYLAARLTGTPIVIHEANAHPGMANKLGARFTPPERIGFAFAGTPLPGEHVGMPMRAAIEHLDRRDPATREAAARHLGLDPALPTIIVTGGSLGAQTINDAMLGAMEDISSAGVQVLHITGRGKGEDLRAAAADQPHYHVVDYVDGMENVYLAADLLVCRAGAGTVAEVSVMCVPAVYVPLAIGNGEQRLNASSAVKAGAATMVANADFTAEHVRTSVLPLVTNPAQLEAMERAAEALDFPLAAARTMVGKIFAAAGRPHPARAYPAHLLTKKER